MAGGGAYDLAVALFDGNVAPATVELAPAAPQAGAQIEIIGFGVADIYTRQGAGPKRRGTNVDPLAPASPITR